MLLVQLMHQPQHNRCLLVEAGILLYSARVLLAIVGLKRSRRLTIALARMMAGSRFVELQRIIWAFSIAAKRLSFSCLINAIAGQSMLAVHGYPSRLCIGAKRDGGEFAAHAWLERDNEVVIGGPAAVTEVYTPFLNVDEFAI